MLGRSLYRTLLARWHISRVASSLGVSGTTLISSLGRSLEQEPFSALRIEYADFGGRNNSGMFLHYKLGEKTPFAISKIQPMYMAEREARFMRWQQDCAELLLSPKLMSLSEIAGTDYAIMCSEYVESTGVVSADRVHELHNRFSCTDYHDLGLVQDLNAEIVPDTPIKDVLKGLVSKSASEDISLYLRHFLAVRDDRFQRHPESWAHICRILTMFSGHWSTYSGSLGLVHGDFKKQNILSGDGEKYTAIDLQYYLVGQTTWDMSFYYSKRSTFILAWSDYCSCSKRCHVEDARFLAFYIIAILINIKRKHVKREVELKLLPATRLLEEYLNE